MKELHDEGLATHIDPESCAGVREGTGEALTGARVGWVLNREIRTPGCRHGYVRWKAIRTGALPQVPGRSRAVGDPTHARNLSAREPGDPAVPRRSRRGASERLRL
jgi:hypothetical protein